MATKQPSTVGRLVPIAEVQKSRRGRTAEFNDELLAFLAEIPADGSVAGVVDMFGPQETKEGKGKVAQKIRQHWAKVHGGKPTINWSPADNLPQVSAKVSATA